MQADRPSMSKASRQILSVVLLLAAAIGVLVACQRFVADEEEVQTQPVASPEEGGAVSRDPMPEEAMSVEALPQGQAAEPEGEVDWSPRELSGQAWISCSLDYREGDGAALASLEREALREGVEA